jgi:hypothetical protein
MFQCEGPECRGGWTSYLNGGCVIHKFRDGWNLDYSPASRASGKLPEKKPKKQAEPLTIAEMFESPNPNHVDDKKKTDKKKADGKKNADKKKEK